MTQTTPGRVPDMNVMCGWVLTINNLSVYLFSNYRTAVGWYGERAEILGGEGENIKEKDYKTGAGWK